jgi:hypothetical protein
MFNKSLTHIRSKFTGAVLLALVLALAIAGIALALTLANADGIWSNARTGNAESVYCLEYNNTASTTDENQVRYGREPDGNCSSTAFTDKSGFGFDGNESLVFNPGDVFIIGQFTHYNNPIQVSGPGDRVMHFVDLGITLDFSDPVFNTTFTYTVQLDETPNEAPCQYPGSTVCPDKVNFTSTIPDQNFTINGVEYTLQILGFAPGTANTCQYVEGQTINSFITEENQQNDACLFGRIIEAPTSSITIIKDSDPNHYRDFQFDGSSTSYTPLDPSTFFLDDDDPCDSGLGYCDGNQALLSNTQVFTDLLPGTYSITETYPVTLSWLTSPAICTAEDATTHDPIDPYTDYSWTSGPDAKGGAVSIDLASNQDVTCTFNNINGGATAVSLAELSANQEPNQAAAPLTASFFGALLVGCGLLLIRKRTKSAQLEEINKSEDR